jgi:branched-subunit amino acid permease
MSKRKTGLFYFAAFFIIMGAGGFIMPLIRGEIGLFSLFGAYALYAKIGFFVVGAVLGVIGLVRFLGSAPTDAADQEKKAE